MIELPFPQRTSVKKRIPKQKFYDNLDISPAVKKSFVEQIQAVHWVNKLSPATTTLVPGKYVSEIEFFEIALNSPNLDEAVLRQIDRQIPYHIVFLLSCSGKYRLAVSHKEAAESGTNAFKVNRYFYSDWMAEESVDIKISGLTTDEVWESIIAQIGNIQIEAGNTLDEQIRLNEEREKLDKEIARLEKLARKEIQPKKKFEIVRRINELRKRVQSK